MTALPPAAVDAAAEAIARHNKPYPGLPDHAVYRLIAVAALPHLKETK